MLVLNNWALVFIDRAARIELIKIHTRENKLTLTDDEWRCLGDKTEGYSGSDIATMTLGALFGPIRDLQAAMFWYRRPGIYCIVFNVKKMDSNGDGVNIMGKKFEFFLAPFLIKGQNLKGRICSSRSKSFPLRIDFIQEELCTQRCKQDGTKVVFLREK